MDNKLILPCEVENVSDGFHTFKELYEHRIRLFISLAQLLKRQENAIDYIPKGESIVWCSTKHSDGSSVEDWFVLGIEKGQGRQITYHLPSRFWSEVCEFAEVLEIAPEWDGHTSEDVLKRLKNQF
jgi:hypothetical protein